MMFKAMLVDDEPVIIEGLKKIVNWEDLGFDIVDVAYDGVEALLKIENIKPDFALVDIRIPGIDGLELIKKVREKKLSTRIIILSGYSEFEYAQKALELDVEGYLLKPVNKELLEEKVKKVWQQLYEEIENKRVINSTKKITKEKAIEKLILGELNCEDIDYINKFYGFDLPWGNYQVSIVDFIEDEKCGCEISKSILKVKEIIDKFLEKNNCGYSTVINNKVCILFKNFWYPFNSRSINMLKESLNNYFGKDIVISIGNMVDNYINIPDSFNQANQLLKKRFLFGYKGIVFAGDTVFDCDDYITYDDKKGSEELASAIECENFEKINQILEQKAQYLLQKNVSEQDAKSCFYNLFVDVLYRISKNEEYKKVVENNIAQEVFKNFLSQKSLTELKGMIKFYFVSISEEIKKLHTDDFKEKVEKYINSNYNRDIKLEHLAGMLGYNSSYFCKLFKKTFGENYSTYIEKIKIEKAKEFLRRGEKVSDVAKKVGYEDVDYFCSRFKKYIGCSPKEYRNKSIKNEKEEG